MSKILEVIRKWFKIRKKNESFIIADPLKYYSGSEPFGDNYSMPYSYYEQPKIELKGKVIKEIRLDKNERPNRKYYVRDKEGNYKENNEIKSISDMTEFLKNNKGISVCARL